MKTFHDVVAARAAFLERQNKLLEINLTFFKNLLGQIARKGEIPDDNLICMESGKNVGTTVVEDCLELDEKGSCRMKIEIVVTSDRHDILLSTQKNGDMFELSAMAWFDYMSFKFQDSEMEKPEEIDFSKVVDQLFSSIAFHYEVVET
ncbi:hypothetical protein [Flavobacterium sp.]|uniref:hypothetical protein n=1 Tax=Flavobacterium sp. TaxID=239 RepID=UPI001226264C|nr:hypothetical protein [Flavobacterium sp.]RZJ70825.1 MAG: hypothetical protein EOO49_11835 [Flavobacterium sp.]